MNRTEILVKAICDKVRQIADVRLDYIEYIHTLVTTLAEEMQPLDEPHND